MSRLHDSTLRQNVFHLGAHELRSGGRTKAGMCRRSAAGRSALTGRRRRDQRAGRAMPSFAILDWSVVRFIPSRAAAPTPRRPASWLPRGLGQCVPARLRQLLSGRVSSGAIRERRAVSTRRAESPARAARQDHGPLDEVLQFPDVARPGVPRQGRHRLGRNPRRSVCSSAARTSARRAAPARDVLAAARAAAGMPIGKTLNR